MADPKYANLPGIAHDEPDVYETTDLPESEQAADFYEEPENESIERIHLSADEAFNKFKGKFLNANNVDFSSRISKKMRTGYDALSGDWELRAAGEKETPIQKYNRLQCEMKELLEEVGSIDKTKKDDKDCMLTTQQVEQSLKKLADLKLEETLGAEIVSQISDPPGAQIKKLLSQLEQFKKKASEKSESQQAADEDAIVYQFNYRPEQAKLQQTTRLAELEARLHFLENVLGSNKEKLARLSAASTKSSLWETAQHLSATASLLDSSQLDHIEGRLSALAQKLESIAEKKKQIEKDEEKDKMILELYDLVKNSENITKLLPQTIERLKALEALHTKAADFTKTMSQIELMQSEIAGNVENNKTLLQGVQESFAMNLNEINQTVISLDARIKALKKK